MDCHKDCHEIFNESFNELSTTDWRYTIPIANHEQHQHNIYIYIISHYVIWSPPQSCPWTFALKTFQCVQVLLPVEPVGFCAKLCEVQGRVSDHQTLGARYLAQVPMWDGVQPVQPAGSEC